MKSGYKKVRGMIKTFPLPLKHLNEPVLEKYVNSLLPYSVGIEVECHNPTYSQHDEERYLKNAMELKKIPYLMECSSDYAEQRFRIPPGINGFICLYYICKFLKETCAINPLSGIHYHIDFTKEITIYSIKSISDIVSNNSKWVLKALDTWDYKGNYNDRRIDRNTYSMANDFNKLAWVRYNNDFFTYEFRIGEMTFEYDLMVKRILHLQNICKALKADIKKNAVKEPHHFVSNTHINRDYDPNTSQEAMTYEQIRESIDREYRQYLAIAGEPLPPSVDINTVPRMSPEEISRYAQNYMETFHSFGRPRGHYIEPVRGTIYELSQPLIEERERGSYLDWIRRGISMILSNF